LLALFVVATVHKEDVKLKLAV
jgi:hypothetical protein